MGLFDTVSIEMVFETCITCGVVFGLPETLGKKLQENHRDFHCPNGHQQRYIGKTEAEKLREEKVRLQAQLDQALANGSFWHEQHDATQRSLRGTRAVVTRMKRRVSKGVCVCCSKKFKDLEAHMKAEHPDWNPDKAAEALASK